MGLVSRVDRESRNPGRLAVFREDAPPLLTCLQESTVRAREQGVQGGREELSLGGGRQVRAGAGSGSPADATPGESRKQGACLPGKPGPRLGARASRPRPALLSAHLHASLNHCSEGLFLITALKAQ